MGRGRKDPAEDLCAEYRSRIERFAPIRDQVLKPLVQRQGLDRLSAEAELLRAAAPSPCRWVALDRRGRSLNSTEFSALLARWQEEWPHPIVFALGSDLGLDAGFCQGAELRWSLSPLTLPHSLARLVVYEQIYRGLSLRAGIKYHRDPL